MVNEINYAITSVSKYNTKIDPSKKLTNPSADKIAKIIQVYNSESFRCTNENETPMWNFYHKTSDSGAADGFYKILHSSYFIQEGAQQINSLLV